MRMFFETVSLSLSVGVIFTLLCLVLAVWKENIMDGQPVWISVVTLLSIISAICVVIIWRQPESKEAVSFKVHTHVQSLLTFFPQQFNCSLSKTISYAINPSFFMPSPLKWHVKLDLLLFLCRCLCFLSCPWSVFLLTSTSWCRWTDQHGFVSQFGWLLVRSTFNILLAMNRTRPEMSNLYVKVL